MAKWGKGLYNPWNDPLDLYYEELLWGRNQKRLEYGWPQYQPPEKPLAPVDPMYKWVDELHKLNTEETTKQLAQMVELMRKYAHGSITTAPGDVPKSTHQGVIVGFRYWTVKDYKLASIAQVAKDHLWQPGVNHSRCLGGSHESPYTTCHCGFNLRAEPSALSQDLNKDTASDVILGACLAWGRTLMHGTAGCRVQYARPVLLAYDPSWTRAKQRLVQGLAEDYDCRAMPVSYPDIERGVCEPLLEAAREYGKLMNEMETK